MLTGVRACVCLIGAFLCSEQESGCEWLVISYQLSAISYRPSASVYLGGVIYSGSLYKHFTGQNLADS